MSKLYGLLGEKLSHSLSPQIHSEIFKALKIDGYYHLFEVKKENLEKGFEGFKALGIAGINVTIPYKVDVNEYLDKISEEAVTIGAVNTILFRGNKAIGYNTDYHGFGIMLERFSVDIKNKKAVILGTGGAAKAVVKYLKDNNIADIILVTRDKEKTRKKFSNDKAITYDELNELKNLDIIVNCTPVGMYPHVNNSPVDKQQISRFNTAIDLIYNPLQTVFLSYAKEQGLKTVDGLYMLVGQAVKAAEIWNNVKIDQKSMDRIYAKIKGVIVNNDR